MIKVIRLRTVKGGGSRMGFIANNIKAIKPTKDHNTVICMISDPKGIEVYESTDEIVQMIEMETIVPTTQHINPINYPQLEADRT